MAAGITKSAGMRPDGRPYSEDDLEGFGVRGCPGRRGRSLQESESVVVSYTIRLPEADQAAKLSERLRTNTEAFVATFSESLQQETGVVPTGIVLTVVTTTTTTTTFTSTRTSTRTSTTRRTTVALTPVPPAQVATTQAVTLQPVVPPPTTRAATPAPTLAPPTARAVDTTTTTAAPDPASAGVTEVELSTAMPREELEEPASRAWGRASWLFAPLAAAALY